MSSRQFKPSGTYANNDHADYEPHYRPHSKTPGGTGASEKFLKQQAQSKSCGRPLNSPSIFVICSLTNGLAHGEGADNATGHTGGKKPGEAPVASDSGNSNVGVERGTNQRGEKGIGGPTMDSVPESLKDTRGA